MKNKQEQAQALLDAMDQLDESLLQQAHTTDTPERFRGLGKAKPIKTKPERPVSALRRWGGVAACLALILALAVSPWFFSSLLSAITPPGPTQPPTTEPTIPPTTTEPTQPPTIPWMDVPDLVISDGDQSISAVDVGHSWYFKIGDKTYGQLSEGHHPLYFPDGLMPWLTVDTSSLLLEFDAPPDSIEVICWDAKHDGNMGATNQAERVDVYSGWLQLKAGRYIYKVSASWSNYQGGYGNVSYVFAVAAPENLAGNEYTSERGEYLWPSMLYDKVSRNALKSVTACGTFYCFTSSQSRADEFIEAQQKLLALLGKYGVWADQLTYYATDYDDSFSRSEYNEAYISLSAVKSWKQVLVTLQTIWGDYTDYGYVYAMSNQIAQELGWKTDSVTDMNNESLALFFQENPDAIHLLYPSFTTEYAAEETVRACKLLSRKLFFYFHWPSLLAMDLEMQLDLYSSQVSSYAQEIGISYTRQNVGYAYCSARIPLKIKALNAEFYVDSGYVDGNEVFKDAFSDYTSIYETANQLYLDISHEAVKYWYSPEIEEPIAINFISAETASARFGSNFRIRYTEAKYGEAVHTRYLSLYMYGYMKHVHYSTSASTGQTWQAEAFCELGRSNSWFAQYASEVSYGQNETGAALFYAYTGRTYQPGQADFFEANSILCHLNNLYTFSKTQLAPAASMAWYLAEIYGEELTHLLLLFPDLVEPNTGKTWQELEAEWAQHLKNKYADVVVPEDLFS